jgi:general secretion pathway protein K
MLAAVAAVAVFGYLAMAAISGGRSAVVGADAGLARARLTADADAGVALAIHELGLADLKRRWRVSDPPHQIRFQGATLAISLEDENGKLPLNFLNSGELRRLFALGGADPGKVDALVAEFLDLRGDPTLARAAGAPPAFPSLDPRVASQRGPLSSLEELALLPDMTPALYSRIAPAATVHAVSLAFDPAVAGPLAMAVMAPDYAGRPALAPGPPDAAASQNLEGHTLTVHVDADDGRGGRLRRTAVVSITGAPAHPFVMRGVE